MSQATALQTLAREVSEDDTGEVARLVCEVGFPISMEKLIVDDLNGVANFGSSTGNTKLQDWHEFIAYLPQRSWDVLISEGATGNSILSELVTFLLAIGLRHPSCPTYGVITCFYCWLTYGEEVVMKMDKFEKFKELTHVKTYFRLRSCKLPDPSAYVVVLPPKPCEFFKSWPSLAAPYKGESPSACPLDQELIISMASSFPLRKPRGGAPMSQALVSASPGTRSDFEQMPGQATMFQMMQMINS